MKKIDIGDLSPYYKTDDAILFLGDSFSVLEKLVANFLKKALFALDQSFNSPHFGIYI